MSTCPYIARIRELLRSNLKFSIALTFAFTSLLGWLPAAPAATLAEKDIAIALPHNMPGLIGVTTRLTGGEPLFPLSWYETVLRAYASTPVANALRNENKIQDWKLVSLRIAPCEPIGAVPDENIDSLCWPEVRLVWQPVLRDFVRFGRRLEAFSDDRAIHVSYRIAPELVLKADEAGQALALLRKADEGRERPLPLLTPLSKVELQTLSGLRAPVVRQLLADTLQLRSSGLAPKSFQGLGLRPETAEGRETQDAFMGRLLTFLSRYARPNKLHAMTSFSLPEGRDPPLLDEWIFIAFKGSERGPVQVPIALHSVRDGRALGSAPLAQRASMNADDDSFTADFMSPKDWQEAQQLVLVDSERPAAMKELLSDRRRILIRNTSCASCHKIGGNLFDFHNFSFLEDQELSVASRVVVDVELDLAWIRKYLGGNN